MKDKKQEKERENRQRQKRMRQLSRRKKNHYKVPQINGKKYRTKRAQIFIDIPSDFSMTEDLEEVVFFFSDTLQKIHGCIKGDSLFFNLRSVQTVSPDAIMYLIALINNTRRINMFKVRCGGNLPDNKEARNIFESVGFFDFVKSNWIKRKTKDPDRIQIIKGADSNAQLIGQICDFVNEKNKSNNKLPTKRLYSMLIELMNNTRQHAYRDYSGMMSNNWYMYVENREKDLKFVFLDTGLGIPKTISKRFSERITELVGQEDDGEYIAAALRGEFRTETKCGFRGKGLPEIYETFRNIENQLMDLTILSGRGLCIVGENGSINSRIINSSFEGTLFSWVFVKGEVCDDRN